MVDTPWMNWKQLRQLRDTGIKIGKKSSRSMQDCQEQIKRKRQRVAVVALPNKSLNAELPPTLGVILHSVPIRPVVWEPESSDATRDFDHIPNNMKRPTGTCCKFKV